MLTIKRPMTKKGPAGREIGIGGSIDMMVCRSDASRDGRPMSIESRDARGGSDAPGGRPLGRVLVRPRHGTNGRTLDGRCTLFMTCVPLSVISIVSLELGGASSSGFGGRIARESGSSEMRSGGGKDSEATFQRLSPDQLSSRVKCRPGHKAKTPHGSS